MTACAANKALAHPYVDVSDRLCLNNRECGDGETSVASCSSCERSEHSPGLHRCHSVKGPAYCFVPIHVRYHTASGSGGAFKQ